MIISNVENIDCIEGMKQFPDKFFDLAICDPPYGINAHEKIGMNKGKSKWIGNDWDKEPPNENYFQELFRISRNQIIWGGNYFLNFLTASRCFLVWDKMQRIDQADAELAWTSFKSSTRVFQFHNSKLIGFQNPNRFHPTEKPIELYNWLLENYAKQGDKILDTHLGSQSSRIAAYKKGFDFWGFEIDKDYFEQGNERFEKSIAMPLFDSIQTQIKQLSLV